MPTMSTTKTIESPLPTPSCVLPAAPNALLAGITDAIRDPAWPQSTASMRPGRYCAGSTVTMTGLLPP